jgi:hypothetical protein
MSEGKRCTLIKVERGVDHRSGEGGSCADIRKAQPQCCPRPGAWHGAHHVPGEIRPEKNRSDLSACRRVLLRVVRRQCHRQCLCDPVSGSRQTGQDGRDHLFT